MRCIRQNEQAVPGAVAQPGMMIALHRRRLLPLAAKQPAAATAEVDVIRTSFKTGK
jgi:hypothetical protein